MNKTGIYNVRGTLFYIDKDTGDMYQKKQDDNDFKKVKASIMEEALSYYKGVNKIYQPFTVLIYRAWKNGQISQYKGFLSTN